MLTRIIDVSWIKNQEVKSIVEDARKKGLQNIKNGWPSHQAVFKASCDTLQVKAPFEVLRALSGFSRGIAQSGIICGALCGGIASLGYFFGNNEPLDFSPSKKIIDNHILDPAEKIHAFQQIYERASTPYVSLFCSFKNRFGSISCDDLISQFYPNLISRERFYYCQLIISETSGFVVETACKVINNEKT